ncbi:MAG: ABC transporter permease [Gammaproteobacteria bacterium]
MAERGDLMRVARRSARALRRDLRNAHLFVVALALVIAVASMTAVGTFTDRVQRALTAQASSLLAADLALSASRPLPIAYRRDARAAGLATSEQLAMRSMVGHAGGLQMIELKAVGDGYPLRGALRVATAPFAPGRVVTAGPPRGQVWAEARLLSQLNTQVGARLKVGTAEFVIGQVLQVEPDRAGDLFSIAPRVMMHLDDVPSTGLVLPGSRVQYSLLVAGDEASIGGYAETVSGTTGRDGIRLVRPAEARPEVRSALEHAEQFLGLAALVATTLAGLAILVAAHSFAREQVDAIAVWRTLGATRALIGWHYTLEILFLGVAAGILGAALGRGFETGLAHALSGWLRGELPRASWLPAIRGMVSGTLALAGFALPLLLALREVPPARVLRRDLPWTAPRPGVIAGGALAAVGLLAPWGAGDPKVTWMTLGGLAGCLVALFVVGRLALMFVQTLRRAGGRWWLAGVTNLTRRPGLASLQVCALGLGIMALVLLGLVRTDLVAGWTRSLPPDAPDQFLINIEPADVPALDAFLDGHGIRGGGIYSMVRARLVAINDRPVDPDAYADPRARRLADREFNLSAAESLKADNRLVAGEFWTAGDPPEQFSFEVEIAETLGIRLGDTITYRVADRELSGEVTSLRSVNWETMEANFFVVAPPALLAQHPATWITSFKLPARRHDVLQQLAARFPSVTIIDVMALLDQVRAVMDRALAAIEFVFYFTLAAGLVVVFAAVQATHGERLHDATVMKTLGATRGRILGITSVEFVTLGSLAGAAGALGASAAAWLLATRVMHIEYTFNPALLAAGAALGTLAVWLAGLRAVITTWRQPVAQVLRDWS